MRCLGAKHLVSVRPGGKDPGVGYREKWVQAPPTRTCPTRTLLPFPIRTDKARPRRGTLDPTAVLGHDRGAASRCTKR